MSNLAWAKGEDPRHCGVNQVEVIDKVRRNRVRKRADTLLPARAVREHGEVRVEELVRLADRHFEGEPVAGRRERRSTELVLAQPCVDGVDGTGFGRSVCISLQGIDHEGG